MEASELTPHPEICNYIHNNILFNINELMTDFLEFQCVVWARQQHARLSRSGPGFDPRSGQVSWVRLFRGFSSPVRQMSGSFRPPRSLNLIWPSLSSSLIHYWRQWPEMLTRPKTLNIHRPTYFQCVVCTVVPTSQNFVNSKLTNHNEICEGGITVHTTHWNCRKMAINFLIFQKILIWM